MKKFSLIVLVLVSQVVLAQATRFVYQVSMKTDSANREEVKTEMAYLDVTQEKSLFYAENRLKRDSLMNRMRQSGSFNFDRSQMENLRSNIDYTIEKDSKKGVKTFSARIARDQYSYDEDRTMDWKIFPETVKIGEYKAQKAQTEFGGRTWNAWFTTDIPFQDGPYKFSGLPGLIVKIEDTKGDYSFDLKETKKITEPASFSSRGNIVKVKREAYEKQMDKFKQDPLSFIQAGGGISGPMSRNGSSGFRSPDPNFRKQMEERIKEQSKKNNNPIELK